MLKLRLIYYLMVINAIQTAFRKLALSTWSYPAGLIFLLLFYIKTKK
jgi:uncharacterized integral membrane protein